QEVLFLRRSSQLTGNGAVADSRTQIAVDAVPAVEAALTAKLIKDFRKQRRDLVVGNFIRLGVRSAGSKTIQHVQEVFVRDCFHPGFCKGAKAVELPPEILARPVPYWLLVHRNLAS